MGVNTGAGGARICSTQCCDEESIVCSSGITLSISRCHLLPQSVGVVITVSFSGSCSNNDATNLLCEPTATPGEYQGTSGSVTVTVTVETTHFSSGLFRVTQYIVDGPDGTATLNRSGNDFLMTGCDTCPTITATNSYQKTRIEVTWSGFTPRAGATATQITNCNAKNVTDIYTGAPSVNCQWGGVFNSRIQRYDTTSESRAISGGVGAVTAPESAYYVRDYSSSNSGGSAANGLPCPGLDCCDGTSAIVTGYSEGWV